ncbi:GNAT family N-acetyltransferase [Kitasatospora cineracea]|uniref:Acetyltransferase (GNAT) family protein n=1 Tax=Kitasatospora cineracea TaxID=88074 RepID=A0A3N4S523_9ACTN|nr:GNAT family N-acetyltransferase [Kitasatospora cineracea]RPE35657.1 acetyltransferase (GNAT) family protein [Kitasatospora cineracea]
MGGGLTYRGLEPADVPAVLELLTASLAGGPTGRRSAEFFDWKHRENPFGSSPGLVAVADGGRVVGVRLFLRWCWRGAGGREVRAVRPVDTATHPDFRGRGIFRGLTTELLEQVRGEAELVFNTPNGSSLPGYLRMGWRELGRVPVALRVARPVSFARGARSALARRPGPSGPPRCELPTAAGWLASPDARPAAQLAELLAERERADAADPRLHTVRTPQYLAWRYGTAPGLDYRVATVERGGELVGVAFGRPRRRGPLAEFTLAELIVRPGDRAAAARLLRTAAASGCDHAATHLSPGTEAAAAALRAGCVRAPRTGMVLAARTPAGPLPAERSLADWRFSLGDLEVF